MKNEIHGLVLGFHGCDKDTGEKILSGKDTLRPSKNEYDWLGHGIYFWENDSKRAGEYAKELVVRERIKTPFVIGAVIDLGYCLNLISNEFLKIVKEYHLILETEFKRIGKALPENSKMDDGGRWLLRPLDCAVIELFHKQMEKEGERPFETTRGVFVEGKALYPGSGFNAKNHIQICVRDNKNIIATFRVS